MQEKTPPSLHNIFTEIQTSLYPETKYEDLFKTNNLTCWAKQGVLMFNTVFTVEEGIPNSHKNMGWEKLTTHILKTLNNHKNNIAFLLWGANAKEWKHLITDPRHLVLEAAHPSPFSADKGFFGCNHFKLVNDFIYWNGDGFLNLHKFIDWEGIKKETSNTMKSKGFTPEQWKKIKQELLDHEEWSKKHFGVWYNEALMYEADKRKIDWRTI